MNPHYPKYYQEGGREYPTNWQSPIPVYFLTVASDAKFRFAIGWRSSWEDKKDTSEKSEPMWSRWKYEGLNQQQSESPRLQQLALRCLQGGLLDLGNGGKTSAGYGYFVDK